MLWEQHFSHHKLNNEKTKMMTCRRKGKATGHTAHLPQQRSKNRFFITSLSTCLEVIWLNFIHCLQSYKLQYYFCAHVFVFILSYMTALMNADTCTNSSFLHSLLCIALFHWRMQDAKQISFDSWCEPRCTISDNCQNLAVQDKHLLSFWQC